MLSIKCQRVLNRGYGSFFRNIISIYYVFINKKYNKSYNIKVSLKNSNIDHLLTFLQLGIFKITICFTLTFILNDLTGATVIFYYEIIKSFITRKSH